MDGGAWWAAVHGVPEWDTTEWLHFHFWLSCIGEGNGNPLQCSCLENPRDGGAWWAAVYGVPRSRTQLKRLSSSSRLHLGIWEVLVRNRKQKCMQKFSIEGYYYLLLSKLRTRMKFMLPCEVLKLIMLLPNALFSKKPPDPLLPEDSNQVIKVTSKNSYCLKNLWWMWN